MDRRTRRNFGIDFARPRKHRGPLIRFRSEFTNIREKLINNINVSWKQCYNLLTEFICGVGTTSAICERVAELKKLVYTRVNA